MNLPRCEATDLPRLICGCAVHHEWAFDEDDLTQAELDYLKGNVILPAIPEYRDYHLLRVDYHSREWKYLGLKHVPDLIHCTHLEGMDGMCFECAVQFRYLLTDIPGLVSDLLVAFAKDTTFAERGTLDVGYPEDEDNPTFEGPWTEEAGIQWNPAASKALHRLSEALQGPPDATARHLLEHWRTTLRRPDLVRLAADVSSAVRYAVRVIERPPTLMFYGQCPQCEKDIRQERVDPHDPEGRVHCECGYTATLQDHQAAQLDLGEDRRYTERELMQVLEQGGEGVPVTELRRVLHHCGLVPEPGLRYRWRNTQRETFQVEVYRLGDVRDGIRGDIVTLTSEQVAEVFGVSTSAVRKMVERGDLKPFQNGARPLRFALAEIESLQRQRVSCA